jgi:hypothetical protein
VAFEPVRKKTKRDTKKQRLLNVIKKPTIIPEN